jgi:hypothetical protein
MGNANGLFHRSHAHPGAYPLPPGAPVHQAPARLPPRTTPAARAGRRRCEPPPSRRRLVQGPQTASTLLEWTDAHAAGRLVVNALAHARRGGETGTPTRTASTEQETGGHAGRRAAWGHNTACGTRAAAGRLRGAPAAGGSAQHRSAAGAGRMAPRRWLVGCQFNGAPFLWEREKMIDTQAMRDTIRGIYWTVERDHGHALTRRPLPCNHRVALLFCPSSMMLTSARSGA